MTSGRSSGAPGMADWRETRRSLIGDGRRRGRSEVKKNRLGWRLGTKGAMGVRLGVRRGVKEGLNSHRGGREPLMGLEVALSPEAAWAL